MRDLAQQQEVLLARLFVDQKFRARFKIDPVAAARELGLDESAVAAFANADWVGLDLAARSYTKKREGRANVDAVTS